MAQTLNPRNKLKFKLRCQNKSKWNVGLQMKHQIALIITMNWYSQCYHQHQRYALHTCFLTLPYQTAKSIPYSNTSVKLCLTLEPWQYQKPKHETMGYNCITFKHPSCWSEQMVTKTDHVEHSPLTVATISCKVPRQLIQVLICSNCRRQRTERIHECVGREVNSFDESAKYGLESVSPTDIDRSVPAASCFQD